ncbi:DUF1311 domain-containing protein [Silvibacterium dinghuense]|uniref:DUF1311 domain-containing protein n=2 Tax=Silvibacterium dinghuense TaxID=1560006 RepID=A0A4Q1S9C6_9BACT|nr:DUF1311 domain-containing protein [Silvibacterium dinghuense]
MAFCQSRAGPEPSPVRCIWRRAELGGSARHTRSRNTGRGVRMKKITVGAALLLFSACAVAQLSPRYDRCIARARQNTVQVGICVQKEMTFQDARLNRAYQTRMKAAQSADAKASLKSEELAWIRHRDAQCKINGETVDNVCLVRETANRATQLESGITPQ